MRRPERRHRHRGGPRPMELTNDFRVALPVERAWAVLTDVERIAPCLPGRAAPGGRGRRVPRHRQGEGRARSPRSTRARPSSCRWTPSSHVAVLRAEGRETRGQGNANATITATLTPDGEGTAVAIVTDLTVTGRVAQFGRGVLADVSAKLLDQFVADLEKTVLVDEPTAEPSRSRPSRSSSRTRSRRPSRTASRPTRAADAAPATAEARAPAVRKIDSPEPEPVDLLDTAGTPVAKRVGPVLVAIAVALDPQEAADPQQGLARWSTRPTGPPSRRCSAAPSRATSRSSSATPTARRWCCATRRCSATARRCPPATGWSANPSAPGSPASKPPAASTGPRPRSTPDALADAHARYAAERDAAIPADHDGPRPSGGVGGTRRASSASTPTTPGTSPAATTPSAAGSTHTSTRPADRRSRNRTSALATRCEPGSEVASGGGLRTRVDRRSVASAP